MFVMVMSVRRSNAVTETVSKEININHNNLSNLKNINCINNHLKVIQNSEKNTNSCCPIDKTYKRILPIAVDTSTILSPSALTSAQSAQNPNKFLLTELNNYRKPPTIQVRAPSTMVNSRFDNLYGSLARVDLIVRFIDFTVRSDRFSLRTSLPHRLQVPVATILNDLSPVPAAPAKECKSKKLRFLMSPMTPVGISSNSPDVKAMR
jgi:hypothetical protein